MSNGDWGRGSEGWGHGRGMARNRSGTWKGVAGGGGAGEDGTGRCKTLTQHGRWAAGLTVELGPSDTPLFVVGNLLHLRHSSCGEGEGVTHQNRITKQSLQLPPAMVPLPYSPITPTFTVYGGQVPWRADKAPLQQFGVKLCDADPHPVPLGRSLHRGPVHLHGPHLLGHLQRGDLNGLQQEEDDKSVGGDTALQRWAVLVLVEATEKCTRFKETQQ